MQKLLLLALWLSFTSCGNFSRLPASGETSVNFSVAGPHGPGAATLTGGVMVYAMRVGVPGSKGAIFLASESGSPPPWLIPNGNYDFLAFGYTGAGMSGVMYCGKALSVPLSGGATTVNLALDDNAVCGAPPFSPTNYGTAGGNAPLTFKLAACSTDGDITTVAPPSTGCGTGGSRPSHGNFETVKFSMPAFTRWNPGEEPIERGPGMVTECISGPFNGGGATLSGKYLPMGPFVVRLEAFSISACSGFLGSYTFMNGMGAAHDNSSIRFIDELNNRAFPSIQIAMPAYQPGTSSYLFVRQF